MDTVGAGDWDGDGLDDPVRFRAATGDWHFTTRVGEGVLVAPSLIGFGANARPVVGCGRRNHTGERACSIDL